MPEVEGGPAPTQPPTRCSPVHGGERTGGRDTASAGIEASVGRLKRLRRVVVVHQAGRGDGDGAPDGEGRPVDALAGRGLPGERVGNDRRRWRFDRHAEVDRWRTGGAAPVRARARGRVTNRSRRARQCRTPRTRNKAVSRSLRRVSTAWGRTPTLGCPSSQACLARVAREGP
jgi:hypothetical protein